MRVGPPRSVSVPRQLPRCIQGAVAPIEEFISDLQSVVVGSIRLPDIESMGVLPRHLHGVDEVVVEGVEDGIVHWEPPSLQTSHHRVLAVGTGTRRDRLGDRRSRRLRGDRGRRAGCVNEGYRLRFFNGTGDQAGCWSLLGYQQSVAQAPGGAHPISLTVNNNTNCMSVGTVVHEIGHALGLWLRAGRRHAEPGHECLVTLQVTDAAEVASTSSSAGLAPRAAEPRLVRSSLPAAWRI